MSQKLSVALLEGIQHVEAVKVSHGEQTFEVDIRPLRHTEAATIQRLLAEKIQSKAKTIGKKKLTAEEIDINYGDVVEARYKAWLYAVALATLDETWTRETIDQYWLPKWIEQVGKRVFQLSGIETEEKEGDQDSFRQE